MQTLNKLLWGPQNAIVADLITNLRNSHINLESAYDKNKQHFAKIFGKYLEGLDEEKKDNFFKALEGKLQDKEFKNLLVKAQRSWSDKKMAVGIGSTLFLTSTAVAIAVNAAGDLTPRIQHFIDKAEASAAHAQENLENYHNAQKLADKTELQTDRDAAAAAKTAADTDATAAAVDAKTASAALQHERELLIAAIVILAIASVIALVVTITHTPPVKKLNDALDGIKNAKKKEEQTKTKDATQQTERDATPQVTTNSATQTQQNTAPQVTHTSASHTDGFGTTDRAVMYERMLEQKTHMALTQTQERLIASKEKEGYLRGKLDGITQQYGPTSNLSEGTQNNQDGQASGQANGQGAQVDGQASGQANGQRGV